MCCMWLAENTGCKKIAKNSPSGHHRTTLSRCIFATKACIDNQKKRVKQQYLLHVSPQYGKLWPTSGWDCFGSLGQPSKFQWVSHVGSITAATPTKLCMMYCLAVSCPLMEFCRVPNSLYVQALRCPILEALLHSTPAAGISQTVAWYTEWNYGTFTEGATFIRLGTHDVGFRPTFWLLLTIVIIMVIVIIITIITINLLSKNVTNFCLVCVHIYSCCYFEFDLFL